MGIGHLVSIPKMYKCILYVRSDLSPKFMQCDILKGVGDSLTTCRLTESMCNLCKQEEIRYGLKCFNEYNNTYEGFNVRWSSSQRNVNIVMAIYG